MLKSLHKLRGAAALAVVISHVVRWHGDRETAWDSRLTSFGEQAVAVFFVISGFIIMRSHRREIGQPIYFRAYGLKRFLRIYPCYWFYSVVFAIIGFFGIQSWDQSNTARRSVYEMFAGAFLLPVTDHPVGFLVVSWSLFYEILFYLIFGVFILSRKAGFTALFAFVVISLINRHLWMVPIFSFSRLNVLFLFGVLIGFRSELLAQLRFPLVLLCLGGLSYFVEAYFRAGLFSPSVCITAVFLVAGTVQADERSRHHQSTEPGWLDAAFLWLGTISYSLYLCHVPVQTLVHAALGQPSTSPICAIAMILAPIGVASLTYWMIELPAQRLARHLTRSGRPPVPVVAQVFPDHIEADRPAERPAA